VRRALQDAVSLSVGLAITTVGVAERSKICSAAQALRYRCCSWVSGWARLRSANWGTVSLAYG